MPSPPLQGALGDWEWPGSGRAGGRIMSAGAASLRLVAGTLSSGYTTISSVAGAMGAAGTEASGSGRERVTWARFDTLDLAQWQGDPTLSRDVLLLGYSYGFQVWDVHAPSAAGELLSRRDSTVRCVQPLPAPLERDEAASPLHGHRPILAVVPCEDLPPAGAREGGRQRGVIELHSLRSQTIVHLLSFHGCVVAVQATPRAIAVSLEAQVHVLAAHTLEPMFTAMTYPVPSSLTQGPAEAQRWCASAALGPRWLAFASNQSVHEGPGAAAKHVPGGKRAERFSYSDYMKTVAAQAAASSGKQLRAGLSRVADAGFKMLSSNSWSGRRGHEERPSDAFARGGDGGASQHDTAADSEVAGTVTVRDVVQRTDVAHFRAHTAPLGLLAWDPSGLMLVTASVYGHNINVFQISPSGGSSGAVHLFKLSRGMTPALITDVSFSRSGDLLAASSARGTTHLFRLGGAAGSPCHLSALVLRGERPGPHHAAALPHHMGPVGRLRTGSGWCSRVPGAPLAAAAAGFCSGSNPPAVIATKFTSVESGGARDEQHDALPADDLQWPNPDGPEEELLVVGPDGALTRYRISQGIETARDEDFSGTSPMSSNSHFSLEGDPAAAEHEVSFEATMCLDACRRESWPERYDIDSELLRPENKKEKQLTVGGPFPRMGMTDEDCHGYISNAEISRPPAQAPLWATAPQFHFLEIQPQSLRGAIGVCDPPSSALLSPCPVCVEELPTRRVDVVRGELLPSGAYWGLYDHDSCGPSNAHSGPSSSAPSSVGDHGAESSAAQVRAYQM